ncbi:MobF family relaxase [Streptomyces pristinaespiralis]|uniref:MobF family relaxase n=1 Tax=Streptomyces pristinaespiralis TaxID=38300 RepID=UPI0033EAF903
MALLETRLCAAADTSLRRDLDGRLKPRGEPRYLPGNVVRVAPGDSQKARLVSQHSVPDRSKLPCLLSRSELERYSQVSGKIKLEMDKGTSPPGTYAAEPLKRQGRRATSMAWVSRIVDMDQVEYRLSENAGCYVRLDGESAGQALDAVTDAQVDYRMTADEDSGLVWIGEGLADVGLVAGAPLDEAGKEAARALANGVHPRTGERLVAAELRAHPKAQLAGARLVEAIEQAAAAARCEPEELLADTPKQQKKYATLARMVNAQGERHRLQVDSLHRIARVAGIDLADVYGADELAKAHAHEKDRVNVRVRAYDIVADLTKSASTLWALLGPDKEADFRALVHAAKREAFAELERWVGYSVASEEGQRHRIATGGLLGWSVEHQSARPVDDTPGDPHLHVHLVVANIARCEDGKWRAIANGGMDLHRHARAFDALFKARVRALANERFGVRYERDPRTRAWEIVGVPAELRAHYSRRAAQVDALAGAEASRDEKLRVSAVTRHAKHDEGDIDLRAYWRHRAEALGIDIEAMVAAAAPGPGPDAGLAAGGRPGPQIPPPDAIAREVFDPEHGLTSSEKEFHRAQLLAAVANACPYGLDAAALEELADQVLAVPGFARALPHRGSVAMSHTDRYTTQDILDAEQVIVDQARTRYGDGSAQLTADQAAAALDVFEVASGFTLADEQRATVHRLLTTGHGVDAVIGVAGSGKTSLMEACRTGWAAIGMTYAGASLSAVAAQNLFEGSGIPVRTVASWLQRIESGTGLRGIDVLVLDEAVMTDDRSLARLLTAAAATGTKVIGVGDPQQLQAIGPGGGFEEIHRLVRGTVLHTNRRQKDAAERLALEVWRDGAREQALRMLAGGGRVHATDTAEQAHAQILTAWNEARSRWPDAHDTVANLVVLAARNADVDVLNAGAQAIRRAAGELGTTRTYARPRGEKLTLAVGDIVRVRQNDYRSRRGAGPDVLNGYRAVVTAIDDDRNVQITWRRESGAYGQAWLSPGQITYGAVSLGYAMTIAASQGLTTDTALLYGLGANAFALYPGITRARTENHLWLPTAVLENEETRARLGEPATDTERLDRALHAYAKLLKQDQPDGMVSDQLRAAPEPVDPAPSDEPEFPSWNDQGVRPFGGWPYSQLTAKLTDLTRRATHAERAGSERAREATAGDVELARQPSPGHRIAAETAALIDRAEQLNKLAQQHADTATRAGAEAARAREILAAVQRASDRSRIALRMAGTSRAEQQQLIAQYAAQADAAEQAHQQALQAAQAAQREAWETSSASPLARAIRGHDGEGQVPTAAVQLELLARMRTQLPALEERINTDRAEAVRRARVQVVELQTSAKTLRTDAARVEAEQELRRCIAEQAPHQHRQEASARDGALQQQARQRVAAQRRRAGDLWGESVSPVMRPGPRTGR